MTNFVIGTLHQMIARDLIKSIVIKRREGEMGEACAHIEGTGSTNNIFVRIFQIMDYLRNLGIDGGITLHRILKENRITARV
jgi:hypothetical protein